MPVPRGSLFYNLSILSTDTLRMVQPKFPNLSYSTTPVCRIDFCQKYVVSKPNQDNTSAMTSCGLLSETSESSLRSNRRYYTGYSSTPHDKYNYTSRVKSVERPFKLPVAFEVMVAYGLHTVEILHTQYASFLQQLWEARRPSV